MDLSTPDTPPLYEIRRTVLVNNSYLEVDGVEYIRQATLAAYLATFVVGITGNLLVIYIIGYYSQVRAKSVANYYIWNLAFADLFFTLTLPFFCYATFMKNWPFGNVVCKFAYVIRETNRYASVFTLTALSLDRYLASYYNLGNLRTIAVGKGVCVLVWLSNAAISIPYWIYAVVIQPSPGEQVYSCRLLWPKEHQRTYIVFWTYFQLILGLVAPAILIVTSYVLLAIRLRRILRNGAPTARAVQKPSRRMTRTVVVIVLTFLACQTPYHAVELLSMVNNEKVLRYVQSGKAYTPTRHELKTFITLNAVAQILVFVSSCCNPVIYGLLNENYRKLYSVVLCRCKRDTVAVENAQVEDTDPSTQSIPQSIPHVTYRFQITFHSPCGSRLRDRCSKRKIPITEDIELEEKTAERLISSVS